MKNIKDMTAEEMSFLSQEQMENIPPQDFGYFMYRFNSAKLDALEWDTWDKMTYEQLSYISMDVFSILKEDILQLLIEKFKNNQNTIKIQKRIDDKVVPIQSMPLSYILNNAKRKSKEIKDMINESMKVYQKYKDKHVDDIPESCIKEILMLDRLDDETLEVLRQFDTLPYLIQTKRLLHWLDLNKYQKIVEIYFRNHPKQFTGYKIQKKMYYLYDDIIRVLASQ